MPIRLESDFTGRRMARGGRWPDHPTSRSSSSDQVISPALSASLKPSPTCLRRRRARECHQRVRSSNRRYEPGTMRATSSGGAAESDVGWSDQSERGTAGQTEADEEDQRGGAGGR